uniref:Protein F09G8.5 n=1 Tax=Haemonchus contortus TaxID=6289 RepID=A0A7I4Y4R0_HAECO
MCCELILSQPSRSAIGWILDRVYIPEVSFILERLQGGEPGKRTAARNRRGSMPMDGIYGSIPPRLETLATTTIFPVE